jgi:hypothetical protein
VEPGLSSVSLTSGGSRALALVGLFGHKKNTSSPFCVTREYFPVIVDGGDLADGTRVFRLMTFIARTSGARLLCNG